MQLRTEEKFLTAIAVLLAFAGVRADDPWVIFPCLAGSWVCLIVVCIFHKGSGIWRIVGAVLISTAFVALGARIYFRRLEEERKEVADHLGFRASMQSQNNLRSTVVTLVNSGKTGIKYSFTCHIKLLVANGGQTVVGESDFRNHVRNGTLEAGTGAQYDDCLSAMSVLTQFLDCADIQIRVRYFLESQPTVEELKEHGFVARKIGDYFAWEDRAADQSISDCQRFSKYPQGPPVDRTEVLANAIRARDNQLLKSAGINPEKKEAAILSLDVMAFGESVKESKPKEPDLEKEGFQTMQEYQSKFMEWGEVNAKEFHQKFDSRINRTFKAGRQAKFQSDETSCSIISRSYPPTLDVTRRCGITLGQIAERLPLH
jgi:hypothetical protein